MMKSMLNILKYMCFQGYKEEEEITVANDIRVLLVVVTSPNISWSTEIENITRFVHCTVVSGDSISWDRVQNSVRDEEVDIIHFACHSDENGIDLNSEVIEPNRLLGLCKNSNCSLVFFSSCTSIRLGQMLIEEGVPTTISYVKEISDTRALSIATDFYQALNRGDSLKHAYNNINPGTGELVWLSNGKYAETEANELMLEVRSVGQLILWWLRSLFFSGMFWFFLFLYFWLSLSF